MTKLLVKALVPSKVYLFEHVLAFGAFHTILKTVYKHFAEQSGTKLQKVALKTTENQKREKHLFRDSLKCKGRLFRSV